MMKQDLEEYIYSGIPTFMRAPYVDLREAGGYDVGVLGLPIDHGVSYRDGARHAPRAIREHSYWDRLDGAEYMDLDTDQSVFTNRLSVADVGDLLVHPGDAQHTNHDIEHAVGALRASALPVLLGGDHSITYAAFKGCASSVPPTMQPVGVLHLDAHLDLEGAYLTLPKVWHGNPFRLLIEEGHLSGDRLVTIGPRGLVPREWVDFANHHGIKFYSARRVRTTGVEKILDDVMHHLAESCRSVYVSVDIDCLDPCHAPGTGTPSAGGLLLDEVCRLMRGLRPLHVVGFDLTEVSPQLDGSGRTVIAACDIIWNFLAHGYDRSHL
jgi:agmatinase